MAIKPAAAAVVLSFVFPGLGHAYLRSRRQALVFALPAVVLAVVLGLEVARGADSMIASIITPSGSVTALVLVLLAGGWRVIAMIDAFQLARRRSGVGPGGLAIAAVLLSLTIGMHGSVAYVAYAVYDAGSRIFVSAGPDDGTSSSAPGVLDGTDGEPGAAGSGGPDGGAAGSTGWPTDGPQTPTPATNETGQARVNILLTGADSAEAKTTSTTDTLIVMSINPSDKTVVMISIPRDIAGFPLYDGRTFSGKINSLMPWARQHRDDFPDGPLPTLVKEVGYLVGVPIQYYAAVDLQGFSRLVDEVGGVVVDNPAAINDPQYDWHDGTTGFRLAAGSVRMDGRTALAYATAREKAGAGDFTRAARQQQLLLALREQLSGPEMLARLPSLIEVAGDTVRTNLPTDRLEEFISLGRTIDVGAIDRYVLGEPYTTRPPTSETGGVYSLKLDMDRLAELSISLFGEDSRYAK